MSKKIEQRDVRYFTNQRPEMMQFLPPNIDRVLEIGCGEGIFGQTLKKQSGCEVWGIEPDGDSIEEAENQLDRVLHGKFEDVADSIPEDHFDLLVCNDVIEHIADPELFLKTVTPKLTKDAHMIVSLPNIRYFKNLWELVILKRWRYTDAGVMDRTHLRFFTKWTIEDLFTSNGFQFRKFKGINRSRSFKPLPLIVCSLGYFSDIAYSQYGMLLQRSPGSAGQSDS